MANSIYLASMEGESGKSTIALGLLTLMNQKVKRVAVFRPVVRSSQQPDTVLSVLLGFVKDVTYDECVGVTYEEVHADGEEALARIIEKYRNLERRSDMVIIVGSDYTDVASPTELDYNARVAANLGAPILLILRAVGHPPPDIAQVARLALEEIESFHAHVVGIIVNRVPAGELADYKDALGELEMPSWTVPEIPILASATVAEISAKLDGKLIYGDPALLSREAEAILVAGMATEHVLERLRDGQLVLAPSDRPAILIALLAAHAAEGFPSLAGILLYGGYPLAETVDKLIRGSGLKLPILSIPSTSFEAATVASRMRGALTPTTQRKIDLAIATFEKHVAGESILERLDLTPPDVVTPLMFEADLLDRARRAGKHIVLPEGDDERVLRAASTLLARGVARLTILGEEKAIRARAAGLGLNVADAQVVSPTDPELNDRFATEYARLRAHKGMTVDRAREIVRDVSYFGTMMVHLGLADGMVSGAQHTTAHTIKPAFEIIKTKPGTSIVSSVFFMLMQDRVLVYGDCAVNPTPTAAQLADIAISSANTASQFGVTPRIAMLSYSTGQSGQGADVDKVREATALVRERAPELSVEGPIQYDAAVDVAVARTKLPESDVAGHATVFIFPDLNTGNNTYKAVQRTAGAVAVGPVLQGLNKPVNDLSRGALVHDIINTVAITAVQAQ